MSFKSFIKFFIPPILISGLRGLVHKNNNPYQGNFKNWDDAEANSIGYNSPIILNQVKSAILKIKNNEAIFERDSVLMDHPEYAWPVVSCLQHIALENNESLNLIDFGGSLGSSFFQNKIFLQHFKNLSWTVVEQPNFVECGQEHFENEQLYFKYDIEDAMAFKSPHCILLSGVLQCLKNPYDFIAKIVNLKIPYIIIDRTSFITDDQRLTILKIDEKIYDASYPLWFFNEKDFLSKFSESYDLITDFYSTADGEMLTDDNNKVYWKGYFFKIK